MSAPITLNHDTTTLEIYPDEDGFDEPGAGEEVRMRTRDGSEYLYTFNRRYRCEIDIRRFPVAQAIVVNSWWVSGTPLILHPDMIGAPSLTYTGRLQGGSQPFSEMQGPAWDKYYSGTIVFEEDAS